MITVSHRDLESQVILSPERRLARPMTYGIRAKLMENLARSLSRHSTEIQEGDKGQFGCIENELFQR
jgi:hypothetical protein